jgi:nucleoside-diphosphate-sugar epimerase
VVLRLSLVYGPGVEGNLGAMLRAVAMRRFPPPPKAANRRSMVHVDDVVRAAIAASRRVEAVGRVIVVGDGVPYSTHDIYAAMVRSLGRRVPRRSLPAPAWRALAVLGDVLGLVRGRRAPFDSDSYRKLFGSAWYPPTDLGSTLGVTGLRTLFDALPAIVRDAGRAP